MNDQSRFRKLMKEQNDLTPIVEAYKEYKNCKQNIEDSLSLLEEESDEDEEVLELEDPDSSESGDAGAGDRADAVPKRHHRGGKLV